MKKIEFNIPSLFYVIHLQKFTLFKKGLSDAGNRHPRRTVSSATSRQRVHLYYTMYSNLI